MDYKDYYKILGIAKTASQDEIKKAYRKLAIKYHPDKNQGDKKLEEKFKEINEANEVLGNPEKRKKYDELGENWQAYQQHGGDSGNFDWSKWSNRGRQQGGQQQQEYYGGGGNFSDFFENLFGGGGGFGQEQRTQRPMQGQDMQADLEISLDDAFYGATRQISLNGQKINMKLRPGLRNGQVLRMKGKGGQGRNGGPAGDLLISIVIVKHQKYERKENDLHFEHPLNVYTATLGGKEHVAVFDKTVKVDIPAGTDSGKIFRLKGMGMPFFDNPLQRGDAYVKMMISVPKNLTPAEKELFTQLSNLKDLKHA